MNSIEVTSLIADAKKIYNEIAKEYTDPDQSDAVTIATIVHATVAIHCANIIATAIYSTESV